MKVFSHTQPRENILNYSPWLLIKNGKGEAFKVVDGYRHGNAVVAQLEGIDDRDAAAALMGREIRIRREQLPKPKSGEYYWADLVGLRVENAAAVYLGVVDHLLETGANDVLVVIDGEIQRLIPFLQNHTVISIDLDAKQMVVDWDPDF